MRRFWVGIAPVALLLQGCFSFSSYQSARIVEPDKPRFTASLSRNNWIEEDQQDPGWTVLDIQGRRGTGSDWIDIGSKLSTLFADEQIFGLVFGVDGRVAVWQDHLTVALPISVLVGDFTFGTFQFHPGLIGSVRLTQNVELNGAATTYVSSQWGSERFFNLGLALRSQPDAWVLRPEVAWLVLSETEGTFVQFGIGVEVPLSLGKSSRTDVFDE